MLESLDHLVDDESHGFPVQLALARLLQDVEQRLLHELEYHEDMLVARLLFGLTHVRPLAEAPQQLYNVRMTVQQFQKRYFTLRYPLCLMKNSTVGTYKGIGFSELLDGNHLAGRLVHGLQHDAVAPRKLNQIKHTLEL